MIIIRSEAIELQVDFFLIFLIDHSKAYFPVNDHTLPTALIAEVKISQFNVLR